ncbi:MFS transporter [Nisaea acidiphila]|uniref:Lysosomal dipeptide transporter MFSD1 n=1 Tax=Nisaea acidiphila TaxID=1862145 RepID=A0A9J7AW97_9PROT|nr:MFS transporter [Nisaea acidiphila]UUX49709.1 MFS transporter [Nisaea acidiphila]
MNADTRPLHVKPPQALLLAGWLFASIFFLYAFVLRVSPSVMVDDLMREFAVGGAILGNLSAVYFYVYASIQIPVGVAIDRLGARRLATGAAAICTAGVMVFAGAENIEIAYLGRFLIGLGCACSFVAALSVAAIWFPTRFALLGGLAQAFGVLGGILGQAPFGYAVEQVGWRDTNWAVAVGGAILTVCLFLTVRDKARAHDEPARPLLEGLKRALSNRQTWLAAIFGVGMTGSMLAFGGLWGVPFLIEARGMAKPEAAALASVMFFGWGIGAPMIGWLSDKLGKRRRFMVAGGLLATTGISLVILFPTMPLPMLQTVLALQGFGSATMVLSFAVAREHNPIWANSAALGIINSFVVGSGAVLQPFIGYLLDLGWDGRMADGARVYALETYGAAFVVLPLFCAAGVVAACFIRQPR